MQFSIVNKFHEDLIKTFELEKENIPERPAAAGVLIICFFKGV